MSGGPGCSGWFGSAVDFGPFRVKDDLTFEENIYTWAKDYYLLFIDSPIGSGIIIIQYLFNKFQGLSPVIGNITGELEYTNFTETAAAIAENFLIKFF